MNKEKFMQLAEKAFDEGANIHFHFVHHPEANTIITEAEEALNNTSSSRDDEDTIFYSVGNNKGSIDVVCSVRKEVKSNAV
jgi:hypothetical protein